MRIITGRASSGKTEYILKEIAGSKAPFLLLTPELFSHSYERLLAQRTANQASSFGEVITFRMLADRVFSETSGLAEVALNEAGRLMMLFEAAKEQAPSLKFYKTLPHKPAVLKEMLAVIDRFKCCKIMPEDVLQAYEDAEGVLKEKLLDISGLYMAYNRRSRRRDPREKLDLLAERIGDARMFAGVRLYVDGFSGFTAQEFAVLRALCKACETVAVCIPCDASQPQLFSSGIRTIESLKTLDSSWEIIDLGESKCCKTENLRQVERYLLDGGPAPAVQADGSVSVCACPSVLEECENAAGYIRRLWKKGEAYREFVIASRDFSPYANCLGMLLRRYDIPVFLSEKTEITKKAVPRMLLAALRCVSDGYLYEDMFSYLKTGLTDLSPEECDRLENYVILRNIRGGGWNTVWQETPRGFSGELTDEDQRALRELNGLRQRVIAPLERLKFGMQQAGTGRDYAEALYAFLLEIRADEKTMALCKKMEELGNLQSADEYRQLWDILMEAMEQFVLVEGETEMDAATFCELFPVILAEFDVGSIPVSVDAVVCGPIERVCHTKCRHLILLGANDGVLPKTGSGGGILSEKDMDSLIGLGLEISGGSEEEMGLEQSIVYSAFSCATQSLLVSWHTQDGSGGSAAPSYLVRSLRRLFDGEIVRDGTADRLAAPKPCFDAACLYLGGFDTPETRSAYQACQGNETLEALLQRTGTARGPLRKPENIKGLYGEKIRLTASRVDKFYSCKFAFFMEYGLRARERRRGAFDALEAGTFLHFMLEHTVRELAGDKLDAAAERIRETVERYAALYAQQYLGGLENKSRRFLYLYRRLCRNMEGVLRDVLRELAVSDFQPMDFELTFGEGAELPPVSVSSPSGVTLELQGKIDRVDGCRKGTELYLKVVDYKTGSKVFSITDVWNGLNMQLLVYLFAALENGLSRYRRKLSEEISAVRPAGALYVPAAEPRVDGVRGAAAEDARKTRQKARRRSGIVLGETDMLDALEHGAAEQGGTYLPVRVTSKGIAADSQLASAGELERLTGHAAKKLQEMARRLTEGEVQADPYTDGSFTYCDWCPYRASCQFDEKFGTDSPRRLEHNKDFYKEGGSETDGAVDEGTV